MVELDFSVNIKMTVSDELNARLEQGEADACKIVESHIQDALRLKSFLTQRNIGRATKVEIQDMGPHNVTWNEDR